jgi:hypothetical protein
MKNPKGRIFHKPILPCSRGASSALMRLRGLPMTCSSRRTLIGFSNQPTHEGNAVAFSRSLRPFHLINRAFNQHWALTEPNKKRKALGFPLDHILIYWFSVMELFDFFFRSVFCIDINPECVIAKNSCEFVA